VVAVADATHGCGVMYNSESVGGEVLGMLSEALDEVGGAVGDG
jgi:hypothetical protein